MKKLKAWEWGKLPAIAASTKEEALDCYKRAIKASGVEVDITIEDIKEVSDKEKSEGHGGLTVREILNRYERIGGTNGVPL